MKNKIAILFLVLTTIITSAFAQDISTSPIIPVEVFSRGRQVVTDYLLGQVDHVTLQYTGNSVVSSSNPYLDRTTLTQFGYVHQGSFSELADAISSMTFSEEVIPTPEGWYDVRVLITYWSSDNRILFSGAGYLNIIRDGNGNLIAYGGTFQPWIAINDSYLISAPENISGAKWVGVDERTSDLPILGDASGKLYIGATGAILGDGYLAIADYSGNLTGWNLSNGTIVAASRVVAILGLVNSSDVYVLKNPPSFNVPNQQFYLSDNRVYGRFPLVDLITANGMKELVNFSVPIWGSGTISPMQIIIKPLYLNDGGKSGLIVGQETVLPQNDQGASILIIPPGEYHVEIKFKGVLDYEDDGNAKG